MAGGFDFAASFTHEDDREIILFVSIVIGHAGAEKYHGVIEQVPLALLDGF